MAGTSRIFPSEDYDMATLSVGYRGGQMSNLSNLSSQDMENRRSGMTLQEARWTGVRKKIPGMSGIPAKHSKPGTDDPYLKVQLIRSITEGRGGKDQRHYLKFIVHCSRITVQDAVKLP